MSLDEVLLTQIGAAGVITLSRPASINALNLTMVRAIASALEEWSRDDSVAVVVLRGAGERGLCAGGDLLMFYESIPSGGQRTIEFWHEEYALNAAIASYPKPYVALMDGIVMGAGVGLSAHGSHRVVTERTRFAMPEARIGLAPDVGATWLLSRQPDLRGLHVAMTCAVIGAGDVLSIGLADHCVRAGDLDALVDALGSVSDSADVAGCIDRFSSSAPAAVLDDALAWIDACYSAGTVMEILERLDRAGEDAAAAAALIREMSPYALDRIVESLTAARSYASLAEALEHELATSTRCLAYPDMREGIRALIVDKDRRPRWTVPG